MIDLCRISFQVPVCLSRVIFAIVKLGTVSLSWMLRYPLPNLDLALKVAAES